MKLNNTKVRNTDTLATQAPSTTEAMMAMQRTAIELRAVTDKGCDAVRRIARPDARTSGCSGCGTDADVTGGNTCASLKSEPSFGVHGRWL
jgi:hypothetical protein